MKKDSKVTFGSYEERGLELVFVPYNPRKKHNELNRHIKLRQSGFFTPQYSKRDVLAGRCSLKQYQAQFK